MSKLTHVSLFSGIGGIDLAAEWAGFETVLFVEKNEYCQRVLKKHWPGVPIIGDIRDVRKENVAYATSGKPWQQEGRDRGKGTSRRSEEITLITGGFPCQPFSVAGKRRGEDDDRFLWPEMLRVIKEFKPSWVVGENVAGIINMALDDVCSDLEAEGYEVQPIVLPACGVNAPHRRYRVFIVGYSDKGWQGQPQSGINGHSKDVADATGRRLQQCESKREEKGYISEEGGNWATEPDVGRVAHGIPNRVDRLRALGNAVVPQQIFPILKTIAVMELKC